MTEALSAEALVSEQAACAYRGGSVLSRGDGAHCSRRRCDLFAEAAS
jgi:hypothetical protein